MKLINSHTWSKFTWFLNTVYCPHKWRLRRAHHSTCLRYMQFVPRVLGDLISSQLYYVQGRFQRGSRNHSGFVPRRWIHLFSATRFHEASHSWLNFVSSRRSPRRKIADLQNLCCSVTGNSARRSHHTRTAKVRDNRLFGSYSAKSLEPPPCVCVCVCVGHCVTK